MIRTYDLSDHIDTGIGPNNTLGLWLGPGWGIFWGGIYNQTKVPLVIAELRVQPPTATRPSSTVVLVTNDSWEARPSDTTHIGEWRSGNYGGDRLDATQSLPAWSSSAVDGAGWESATVYGGSNEFGRQLTGDTTAPNGLREAIPAKRVSWVDQNSTTVLVEMEQVFSGWLILNRIRGEPYGEATISVSSVHICGIGNYTYCATPPEFGMQHQYKFDSSGVGDFSPRFSWHETRFALITGLSELPSLANINGRRIGNIGRLDGSDKDVPGTSRKVRGGFLSSSAALNRIYNVSMWTMAELVTAGISVDCPHRERLGYLGDAHTTLETSLQNVDSGAFYSRWLQDMLDVQGYPIHNSGRPFSSMSGYVPFTAPTLEGGGGPGWSGFLILMPWQVYLTFGDLRILEQAYDGMLALLRFWDQWRDPETDLWSDWCSASGADKDGWCWLGDWLTPHGSETSFTSEADMFNNMYITYCTRVVANVSDVLGDSRTAVELRATANRMAGRIHSVFWRQDIGGYLDTRQTHQAMALIAGIVPPNLTDTVWATLEREIRETQAFHLDTGLHGTYFLVKLLTDSSSGFGGRDELVHSLATEPSAPGYLDLLAAGFTAWPEAWGTCAAENPAAQPTWQCALDGNWTSGALSPTHGCLNGVGQWFISGVTGIRRALGGVGYSSFELRPAWGVGGEKFGMGHFDSPMGIISSSWRVDDQRVSYNVTVPVNSRAVVYLPARNLTSIVEGGRPIASVAGIDFLGYRNESLPGVGLDTVVLLEIGSGYYQFESSWGLRAPSVRSDRSAGARGIASGVTSPGASQSLSMSDYWAGRAHFVPVSTARFPTPGQPNSTAGANVGFYFVPAHNGSGTWYLFHREYFFSPKPAYCAFDYARIVVRTSVNEGRTWSAGIPIISPVSGTAYECAIVDGAAFFDTNTTTWHYLGQCLSRTHVWAMCEWSMAGENPAVEAAWHPNSANPVVKGGQLWSRICSGSGKHCPSVGTHDEGTPDIVVRDDTGNFYVTFHGWNPTVDRSFRGVARTADFVTWETSGPGLPGDAIFARGDCEPWGDNLPGGWASTGCVGGGEGSIVIDSADGFMYQLIEAPDLSLGCNQTVGAQNWVLGLLRSKTWEATPGWEQLELPPGNPLVVPARKIGCFIQYHRLFYDSAPGRGQYLEYWADNTMQVFKLVGGAGTIPIVAGTPGDRRTTE